MRLIEEEISQYDQSVLDQDPIDLGYFISCVAYPMSDLRAKCFVEEALY